MRKWVIKSLLKRALVYEGRDSSVGNYYSLAEKVPYEVWVKIKGYFVKMPGALQGEWWSPEGIFSSGPSGWMVNGRKAKEVKEILYKLALEVADEEEKREAKRIREEEERKKREEEERERKREELKKLLREVIQYIKEHGEKPEGKFDLRNKEKIQNPFNPENVYGGGEWFVIDEEEGWIWYVINNGGDSDDWSLNNVITGGAGARGFRVPYTEELASFVRLFTQYSP